METKNNSEQSHQEQGASIPETIHNPVELTDSIIKLTYHPGEELSAKLVNNDQRIHVEVPVTQTDSLMAELILPGENRNVYISHIMLPDQQTDGPFGPAIRYETKAKGTYTLIIGPNTRAEGNPLGEVIVKVELKETEN